MVLALTALLLVATPGKAPPAPLTPEAANRFKGLYEQGERLFEKGEYATAISTFRQAERLRATAEVAFDLAKCNQKLGEHALAAYYYRVYLRRAPTASDGLDVAGQVADILSQQEAEGRGLLEVESPVDGKLVLNGRTYSDFPVAVFLPPGDYEVVGLYSARQLTRVSSVHTGQATMVRLDPPLAPVVSAPDPAVAAVESSTSSLSQRKALHYVSYGLMGLAVAAVAAGSAFGAMSSGDASRLTNHAGLTEAQAQALAASANSKGGTANALWGTGAAVAVAGGLLFTFTLPEPGERR